MTIDLTKNELALAKRAVLELEISFSSHGKETSKEPFQSLKEKIEKALIDAADSK